MVHLLKIAGFGQEMNGNLFIIVSQLQITTNFRIIIYKYPPKRAFYIFAGMVTLFSPPWPSSAWNSVNNMFCYILSLNVFINWFKALTQELMFASHLGVPAILLPLKKKNSSNLARILNQHIHSGHNHQVTLEIGHCKPVVVCSGQIPGCNDYHNIELPNWDIELLFSSSLAQLFKFWDSDLTCPFSLMDISCSLPVLQ